MGVGWPTLDRIYVRASSVALSPDGSEMVSLVAETGGGRVATALVTASRLGWPTRMAANVGSDDLGRRIRDGLNEAGVDVRYLSLVPGMRSAHSAVLVSPGGHRMILFDPGTCTPGGALCRFDDLLDHAVALVLEDGLTLQPALVAEGRRRGLTIMLDLDRTPPRGSEPWPGEGAIVIASAGYLQIAEVSAELAIEQFLAHGAVLAVVTVGAEGALGSDGTTLHHEPASPVAVRDTTGAGDVYHGAFLVAYLEHRDLITAMRVAGQAAALSCRAYGGRAAIPLRSEIMT